MNETQATIAMDLLVPHVKDMKAMDCGDSGWAVEVHTKDDWRRQFRSLDEVKTWIMAPDQPIASREMALHRMTIAAPDLLESCIMMVEVAQAAIDDDDMDRTLAGCLQRAVYKARAAINRATGA